MSYGEVFQQAEQEYSRFNFEHANTEILFQHFNDAEAECMSLLKRGKSGDRHLMALPAYDQCIRPAMFSICLTRDHIGHRAPSYILRVRELARGCGAAWLKTAGGGAYASPQPSPGGRERRLPFSLREKVGAP